MPKESLDRIVDWNTAGGAPLTEPICRPPLILCWTWARMSEACSNRPQPIGGGAAGSSGIAHYEAQQSVLAAMTDLGILPGAPHPTACCVDSVLTRECRFDTSAGGWHALRQSAVRNGA